MPPMSLPILQVQSEPSRSDLVRLFHRTSAMWVGHLADGQTLDIGTAHANRELPGIADANNMRDAALPADVSPAQALAQVKAFYAKEVTRCAYWVMNPSSPAEQTQPLIEHLMEQGYRRRIDDIWYLRKAVSQDVQIMSDLKIIPARASYRHVQMLARENTSGGQIEQQVDTRLRHLDDPHYDALIALRGDRPVASLGVMAVGELAEIQEVYVSPEMRQRGIGRMMMNRGLEICARSLFKHVFLVTQKEQEAMQALCGEFGFSKIGAFESFRRA
jgi:ribosomal protein S18 acetylase RimI-like enzyme